MKIRNGFVSNSSSSSFIIGLANSTRANIGKTFSSADITYREYWGSILDNSDEYIQVKTLDNGEYKLSITSFDDTEVSIIVKEGDKYISVNGVGPDDDSFFYDENYYNCDYDKIDLSDFDADDIKQYELIKSLGGDSTYGAGRDG